jgi:hypothetical protein
MNTFLVIAALLIIGFSVLVIRANRERQKNQDTVENYVTEIFSKQSYRPEVIASTTYGIPSFTLKFKTDDEKEHAASNGLTDMFIKKIQKLCGHLRPRGEEFDAEYAVSIFSIEEEEQWAKKAAIYRNEKNNENNT